MERIKRAILIAACAIPLVFAVGVTVENTTSVQAADGVTVVPGDFGWQ
ncbi:hypothetical protein [Streptomyces sp. NPDC040750]